MIAESIGFVLRNLPAFLLVIALVVAAFHRGRWSTPERFLSWLLLLPVGVTALWAAVFHLFFPSVAAADIGWQVSPFQFEVGMADLAIGATACRVVLVQPPVQGGSGLDVVDLPDGRCRWPRSSDARDGQFRTRQRGRPVFHGRNLSRAGYCAAGSGMAALPGWNAAAEERLDSRLLRHASREDVDGWAKPNHDECGRVSSGAPARSFRARPRSSSACHRLACAPGPAPCRVR